MPKRPQTEIRYAGNGFDHCEYHDKLTGYFWYPGYSDYGFYDDHRYYESVDTPGFKSLKKKQLPDHPYGLERFRCKTMPGTFKRWAHHWTYPDSRWDLVRDEETTSSHVFNFDKPPTSHIGEAVDKAAENLQKKVSGLKVNLAQAFAERKKTAELLASTVTRIATAARALKHGRFGDFVNSLELSPHLGATRRGWSRAMRSPPEQRLANHWLEWKYGWRPLLKDVADSAELLAYHISQNQYHEKVSASAKSTDGNTFDWLARPDWGAVQRWATTQDSRETHARFVAHYRMDDSSRAILAQTGISNPALLAWELLPYSFVVDWFLPVGNYLESLAAYDGFTLVGGTMTQFSRIKRKTTFNGTVQYGLDQWWSWQVKEEHTGSWEYEMLVHNRSLINTWPVLPLPSFRNPIGNHPVDRFATGFALLQQVFGRK